jgi:hypothetical protein
MTRPTVADIVVTGVIVAAGVLLLASPATERPRGEAAVIKSVSDTTRVISLFEDRILVVTGILGETTIKVTGGQLEFVSSPCPHKVCLERGKVAARGDYIVCVPNGVSARINGKSDFDAVVP